jgi:regulator of PEP synthase PpsR (kinase-PPPase family)
MELLMKKIEPKKGHVPKKKNIYLIGEGTGETISKIARASLVQFTLKNVEVKTFFMVTSKQRIGRITKQAAEDDALVAFSIIQPVLRDFLIREAERRGIKAIDVIGDFIVQLSIFLNEKPMAIPGRQYVLDEDYYRRIEAINFAVKHDDGKIPQGLKIADLILVGLSRTGKTPLSTYLANQGWKVANVPIHPDMVPPQELFQVDQHKVLGLIINVETLVKLRESRLEQLGLTPYAKYADPVQVADEIEWCKKFFKQHPRWQVINVSNRAIEEVSASIISTYRTWKKST